MYIKQVTVQGFKSYRERIVVKLKPGLNVIVGLNGSGKSCLFYALQFVLGHEFQHMPREQREGLLHSSAGGKASEALVEIVLSNEDHRIQIAESEVVISRVVTASQDRFYVNKNPVTKTEMNSIMQSAGMSKINPYYIIKQGRVNELAAATDAHRLNVLREVAGHAVWAERRPESIQWLERGSSNLDLIRDYLKNMENTMSSLQGEFDEFQRWRSLDKRKRAIEHFLLSRELDKIRARTDKKQNDLKEIFASTTDLSRHNEELYREEEAQKRTIRDLQAEHAAHVAKQDDALSQMKQILEKKTQLELALADHERLIKESSGNLAQLRDDLGALDREITDQSTRLAKVQAEYEKSRQLEHESNLKVLISEQRLMELYSKQGRKLKFKDTEARNQWIDSELCKLKDTMTKEETLLHNLQEELETALERKEAALQNTTRLEEELAEVKGDHAEEVNSSRKYKSDLEKAKNQQRVLWKSQNMVETRLSNRRKEIAGETSRLTRLAGRALATGIESVEKVLLAMKDEGPAASQLAAQCHGILMDLFTCEPAFYSAVDAAVGKRAFYHVVESCAAANELVQRMNAMGLGGETNFLPLDRLEAKTYQYPNIQSCTPLLHHLRYDEKYEVAMRFVFGRFVICESLDAATQIARRYSLNCVTLQGDQVYSKGMLRGGFIASASLKLDCYSRLKHLKIKAENDRAELVQIKGQLEDVCAVIKQKQTDLQRLEVKSVREKQDHLTKELSCGRIGLENLRKGIAAKQKLVGQYQGSLRLSREKYESLMMEKDQELSSQLFDSEREEVGRLQEEVNRLRKDLDRNIDHRLKLESRKAAMESYLNDNLMKQRGSLEQQLNSSSQEGESETLLLKLQEEEELLNRQQQSLQTYLDESLATLVKRKLKEAENVLEEVAARRKEIQQALAEKHLKVSKIKEEIASLNAQGSDVSTKLFECGTVNNEWNTYEDLNSKDLKKEMLKVHEELKKFPHINLRVEMEREAQKKLYEAAVEKANELDRARVSCREVVSTVDVQKNEALHNTFMSVARYFHQIFKSLVPRGAAYLRWVYGDDSEDDEQDVEDFPSPDVEKITGVSIVVSFDENRGHFSDIASLSGGQKSLISLAFVFAIQMLDRAPFYILDEADMALDGEHRKAVAGLISRLSERSQFIVTTFRPEFLAHTNAIFGVVTHNHTSRICEVSFDEAHDFICGDSDEADRLTSSSIL